MLLDQCLVRANLFSSVIAFCAVVISQASAADYNVLHDFPSGQNDGAYPYSDVTFAHGDLYGTTAKGGSKSNAGIVFKIAPDGTELCFIPSRVRATVIIHMASLWTVPREIYMGSQVQEG